MVGHHRRVSPRTIGAFATIRSMLCANTSTIGSIHDTSVNRAIASVGQGA